jgi:hypothetical protein
MGMHLNWEFHLPAETSAERVTELLTALRERALQLPFEEVTKIEDVTEIIAHPSGDPWFSIRDYVAQWARVISKPDEEDSRIGDLNTAVGFGVFPGKRCEGATYGFVKRAEADGGNAEWFWHHCCKTQYASVVSWEHLIKCHTSLVALLDHAIDLGIGVVVRDEGHYWETRDESRLIAETEYMNQLVARIAGAFSDAMPKGLEAGGAIFEHPEFEHLEMKKGSRPDSD